MQNEVQQYLLEENQCWCDKSEQCVTMFVLMILGKLAYLTHPVCSQPAINYNSNLLAGWNFRDNPLPLSPETRDHFISIVLIRAITTDTSDILKTNNQERKY